jgi:cell division protein FtsB
MPDSPQNPAKAQTDPRQNHWWSQYLSNRRRIGSVAAILIALFLAWHVVNGRNGLNSWQQKRAEDKALAAEIERLTAENAHLGEHVDRLRSDPGAIEHEARARLRYARPNEVIWTEPQAARPQISQPQANPMPAK